MFKRIYTNLFTPSEIGKYLKDKVGYVILYILFLSLLATIPIIIQLSYTDIREDSFNKSIISSVSAKGLDAQIIDYKYTGSTIEPFAVSNYMFLGANSNNPNAMGITFMFNDENLNVYTAGQIISSYSYEALNLEALNLNLKDSLDKDKMEHAFSIVYKDYKPYIIVGESIGTVITQTILVLILILLFTGLYSFQIPKLLLKYRFVLISYASTVYFFTVLLDNLFGLEFISLIGIFIMSFNIRKAFVKTIAISLMQRKEQEEDE